MAGQSRFKKGDFAWKIKALIKILSEAANNGKVAYMYVNYENKGRQKPVAENTLVAFHINDVIEKGEDEEAAWRNGAIEEVKKALLAANKRWGSEARRHIPPHIKSKSGLVRHLSEEEKKELENDVAVEAVDGEALEEEEMIGNDAAAPSLKRSAETIKTSGEVKRIRIEQKKVKNGENVVENVGIKNAEAPVMVFSSVDNTNSKDAKNLVDVNAVQVGNPEAQGQQVVVTGEVQSDDDDDDDDDRTESPSTPSTSRSFIDTFISYMPAMPAMPKMLTSPFSFGSKK